MIYVLILDKAYIDPPKACENVNLKEPEPVHRQHHEKILESVVTHIWQIRSVYVNTNFKLKEILREFFHNCIPPL